jgi:histidinol-phosphate phosphatase family protein
VKIVVHGRSMTAAPRLSLAAAGLVLRGHEVLWWSGWGRGSPPPPATSFETAGGASPLLAARGARADVVLGGGSPVGTAYLARLLGARCAVEVLDPDSIRRWGAIERLAWHAVHRCGIAEAAREEELREASSSLDPETLALWPAGPAPAVPEADHPDTEILERACERTRVRSQRRSQVPAVFLDRDGTLIRETGYLSDPDQVELLAGVPEALADLAAAGLPLVVISNQSGVGRGRFGPEVVHAVNARLRRALAAHGVGLDAIYFCPHAPEDDCPCRKPRPGMLLRAAEDLLIDLRHSFVVGDKLIDVEAGYLARASAVLVRTGYGREEEARLAASAPEPDHVADDLKRAARWILGRLQD